MRMLGAYSVAVDIATPRLIRRGGRDRHTLVSNMLSIERTDEIYHRRPTETAGRGVSFEQMFEIGGGSG
jgi:hypothetical protein